MRRSTDGQWTETKNQQVKLQGKVKGEVFESEFMLLILTHQL